MSNRIFEVLVVDDEATYARNLAETLADIGFKAYVATRFDDAKRKIEKNLFDAALIDLSLDDDLSGLELVEMLRNHDPAVAIVMLTGNTSNQVTVQAVKAGADDYLVKGVETETLQQTLRDSIESKSEERKRRDIYQNVETPSDGFDSIITQSPLMHASIDRATRLARSRLPILIQGETGAGKELFARGIHVVSGRSKLVTAVLGPSDDPLQESRLFGHVRGAFTGADRHRNGAFVTASDGTLFLDETADIHLSVQVGLLRVIEDGIVTPVGSDVSTPVDVRLLAATNKDLDQEVSSGRFREDLLYRLGTVTVEIPSLRERPEDIQLLASHFVSRLVAEGAPSPTDAENLDDDFVVKLREHDWPGNVRELKQVVEQAVWLCDGETLSPDHIRIRSRDGGNRLSRLCSLSFSNAKSEFANWYWRQLERKSNGNAKAMAAHAKCDVATVNRHRQSIRS